MDKKIGNYFLYVALTVFSFSAGAESSFDDAKASVHLKVVDQNGDVLKEAGLGIPFLIEVEVISSTRHDHHLPQLSAPSSLQVLHRGTSNSVRSINGDTVIKNSYTYQAVADQEGALTIGPATVDFGKRNYLKSNTVTITVGAEQKRAKEDKRTDAFVELSVGKNEVYVGEAVSFSIRFCYSNEGTHLEQLQEPTFKGFKYTTLQGPVAGHATIKGVEYQCLEWKTTLFPTQAGRLVIPSLLAYVTLPVKHPNGRAMDMFSLVNHMFGAGKTEQVYSNALTLQVKTLPAHEPPVTAVGAFSSFHAKLSTEKAETGEGVSLVLELVGQGNFQMMRHPQVTLPVGLKYYDSHAKDHVLTDKMFKKDFEYVLQAVQPGVYEIPAQTFEYFDTKNNVYKMLKSRPVKLTVIGEARKTATFEDQEEHLETTSVTRSDELPSLEKTVKGGGFLPMQRISWVIFICLALLFSLPMMGYVMASFWRAYRERNASVIGQKRAFKVARSRLKVSKQQKGEGELYHIFMDLFAARLSLPRTEISEQDIEDALKKAGFSDEKILEWRAFFANLMAVTFSALPSEGNLYEQAAYWLTILEQML